MKSTAFALLFMSCLWIGFITLGSTEWIRVSVSTFALVTCIAVLISAAIIYFILIKPLVEGKDKLLQDLNVAAHHEMQNSITYGKKLEALQKKNLQLQQTINEQKKQEKRSPHDQAPLIRLSHYDADTTLPNRIFFNQILNKAISHANRHKKICALLFIEIEVPKKSKKHPDQDTLNAIIKQVGDRLTKTLRAEDILAKFDTDEFVVLLNDIGKSKFASAVAEKILHTIAKPFEIKDNTITAIANIGICIYPDDGNSLEALLKNAELALTKARMIGNNSYQFYTNEMNIEAHEYIQLGQALRKAVERNEFALYYQPKFRIKTGQIDGVEALIRWVHPEFGNINPMQIITLSEETGTTMKICEWTLREACLTNKNWQDEAHQHISVAVNLSTAQFHHPDLVKIITRVLVDSKLHPSYLELEINESTVMGNIDAAATILESIKALGVQLTIDHFGTGYTSISHLKKFPINFVKIDRDFIQGLPHNPNDIAIVNAFIALAHNLGLEVIAEGVESAEQVQYLAQQNCNLLQGYFLSHPLSADRFINQLGKLRDEIIL